MASRASLRISSIMQQVTVRVPASTSNLGPGFDCLGLALRLYNNVTISRRRGPVDSLVGDAADAFFERTQRKSFPFSCSIAGDVPRARGLGGSATVRHGVVHGLNVLAGRPLQRQEIFEICAGLEGHPDNAAPAAYGGFNVVRDGQRRQMFTVSAQLHFVLLVPNFEIATEHARRVLPSQVDRLHAVENCRNACALTAAFASREYENLRGAFADRLHQPFRKKLIPFLDRVIAAAESAGALGAFLSGSGSTICAVALRSTEKISRAMLAAARSEGARIIITGADNRGARLMEIRNPKSEIRNS